MAIVSVSLALALNPLAVGRFVELHRVQTAYLWLLDLGLAAVFLLSCLHLALRRRLFHVLAVLSAIGLAPAMVAAEFGLLYARATGLGAPAAGSGGGPPASPLARPDPRLGWSLVPNAQARRASAGNYDVVYRIDERGRKAIPQTKGARGTLHFFGDSFTFGVGVGNEESALNLLAQRLAGKFNVRNYGVMGYGLDQMLLRLEDSLDEIDPGDVVVFAPLSWDLNRNLVFKTAVCETTLGWRGTESRLPLWRDGDWAFVRPRDSCGRAETLLAAYPHLPVGRLYYWYRSYALADAIIERSDRIFAAAAAAARQRGARFHLVFLVTPYECGVRDFGIEIERLRTPFASLMPFCPEDPEAIRALRFPGDGHWSPEGNRWAARALESVLAEQLPELGR